jgi:CRP/FNR family transcriptional regulator, anaerobic regulatory protein
MEQLLGFLHSLKPLSPELDAHLRSILVCKRYRRGELLLRAGDVAKRIFYIEKGLVRSFYLHEAEEASNWFMKEGDVCISIVSFLEQKPSEDSLVALEDCETWGISYEQLNAIYDRFPEFKDHGLYITNKYYVWSEKRYRSILRTTPEYKYDHLLKTAPDIARRVTVKDLASFLNISERTFNRVRRDYATNQSKKK